MIIAYAGRRSGNDEFPDENVAFTRQRLKQLMTSMRPSVVVGSAAAGADLLVLDAALDAGAEAHVVLAGSRADFRAGSVADKGEPWLREYDSLLDEERVHVEELPRDGAEPDAWYRAVTARIAALARELASGADAGGAEAIAALIVAAPREQGTDHSEELVAKLRRRASLTLRIDPAATREDCKPAFVAMPFGTKPEHARGWRDFNADASYHRVIVPALIGAGYQPQRADTNALLEVIDHTMLRSISTTNVMIVDLATLNPNVFWELGVRHAWRVTGTILIAPDWTDSPFDIKRVPIHRYRRDQHGIADAEAVAGIETLSAALADVEQGQIVSPVFATLGEQIAEVILPASKLSRADLAASDLLTEITYAQDVEDEAELKRLRRRVTAAKAMPATTRTMLLEQIGFSLIALARHGDALTVLRPLARADRRRRRRRLQEQYAHALIRSDQRTGRAARVREAQRLLALLLRDHGDDAETLGVLGSATKLNVEEALADGRRPDPGDVRDAIRWYERGFRCDPRDYYPGINAVALLRLSGQHWDDGPSALRRARALEPVVRFAIERRGRDADTDVWAQLTLAELALHRHLLDGDAADRDAAHEAYRRANRLVSRQQRRSARRQLVLMRDAGDPAEVVDELLAELE